MRQKVTEINKEWSNWIKYIESQTEKLSNSVDRDYVTSPSQISEILEFLQCPVFRNTKIWTHLYVTSVQVKQETPPIYFGSICTAVLTLYIPTHPSSRTFVHSSTNRNSLTENCIYLRSSLDLHSTRVGTLIVATIYLQLIKIDTCFEVLLSFSVVTSIVYNPLPAMWKS